MAGSCGVVSEDLSHISDISQGLPRSSPSPGAESWKNPGCPSDVPRWTERRKLGSSQMQICNRNWCCLFWTSQRYTKILFDCKPLWEILRTLNIFNSGQKDFLPMEGFDRGFAELFPPRRRNSCRKPGRCLRPKCGSTQNLWTISVSQKEIFRHRHKCHKSKDDQRKQWVNGWDFCGHRPPPLFLVIQPTEFLVGAGRSPGPSSRTLPWPQVDIKAMSNRWDKIGEPR